MLCSCFTRHKHTLRMFNTLFNRHIDLPKADSLKKAVRTFSFTEKTIFWVLFAILSLSAIGILLQVNSEFLVEVPDNGGSLTEGIIGSPRFVNPILAIGDADKDLTSLVYSGLMRITPEGTVIPDLAESYSISPDGLTYDFVLKDDIKFHDGSKITTDDIEFTIMKAQDPAIKSPRRASWDGVLMEKVNQKEIKFILKQAYTPFLSNTTIGILPKKIWKNANADEFAFSEYNTNPIGSGPYKVSSVKRNSAGIPNEYILKAFSGYALGKPHITTLDLKFYQNESDILTAYKNGDIESMNGISGTVVADLEKNGAITMQAVLPRIFGVFFNQNQAQIFTNKEVRQALDMALDKERIVKEVLSGYGTVARGPIPPLSITESEVSSSTTTPDRIAAAQKILTNAGWKYSTSTGVMEKKTKKNTVTLAFSISTSDAPELELAAQKIQEDWQKLGAKVDLQIFDTGDLNQNIIRPRKYDALFFGEIIGRDLDLYPFWHSSQRNDPGLNIAQYVNSKADKALEQARTTLDPEVRATKYADFTKEIENDVPVVFVYSPSFTYILPSKVHGVRLGQITIPGERFLNVKDWYIETNKIWKIFNNS